MWLYVYFGLTGKQVIFITNYLKKRVKLSGYLKYSITFTKIEKFTECHLTFIINLSGLLRILFRKRIKGSVKTTTSNKSCIKYTRYETV